MSFYDWMVNKYAGKNTMRGDFAYDMEHASGFNGSNNKDMILIYLHKKHACKECIQLFKRCYKDYEKEMLICKKTQ